MYMTGSPKDRGLVNCVVLYSFILITVNLKLYGFGYCVKIKVAVHSRGPRKHCVISYVHIQQEIRACAWGQNNSPALHSTVFIRRLRLIELL